MFFFCSDMPRTKKTFKNIKKKKLNILLGTTAAAAESRSNKAPPKI